MSTTPMTKNTPETTGNSPLYDDDFSTPPLRPGKGRPVVKLLVYTVLLAGLGTGVVYGWPKFQAWMSSEKVDYGAFVTKPVTKGPFQITVEAKGTVDSSRNANLVCNVEGGTTIISIVPPGTPVANPLVSKVSGRVQRVENSTSGTPLIEVQEEKAVDHAFEMTKEMEVLVEQGASVQEGDVLVDGPEPVKAKATGTVQKVETAATGPSRVVVVEKGDVVSHTYEMTKFSQIIVQEGAVVKAGDILIGDVVCELDASQLVDQEKQQQIQVTQASADLEKGEKNVEIQITQNESDMASARLTYDLAQLDLRKYKEGDYIASREEMLGSIEQAKEQLTRAEEQYEFSRRLAKKGYQNQNKVEADRFAVLKARIDLSLFQKKLEVLDDFDKPRQIKEYEEMATESEREMARVKLAGEAALAQYEADLAAKKLTYDVEVNKLERLQRQIAACKMVAPQAGQVVYANQSSRRSEPVVIEEGASVRERQNVISLPDLTAMKVDAKIHESKISDIREGLTALIRVDSVPGVVYHGVLESVGSVPLPGNWPNLDLKQYEAVVRIKDSGDVLNLLKPGMSASVEILVERSKEELLQLPVQAAVNIGTNYYTWVLGDKGPERRDLKLGKSNDQTFIVESGVESGELVIMNPRSHFGEEIEELEAKLAEEQKERGPEGDSESPAASESPRNGAGAGGPGGNGGRPGGPAAAGGPGGGGGPGAGGGGPGRFDPAAIFARQDSNKDGKITLDEASEQMKPNFSTMDANGDGGVDLDEFKSMLEKFRAAGGGPGGGGRPPGGGAQGGE